MTNPTFGSASQNDVADNGNNTSLAQTLVTPAQTLASGTTWASVLVGTTFLSNNTKYQQNVALHELLHAFTGLTARDFRGF